MGLNRKYKLGALIEQRREKYDGISDLPVRGVSRDGFQDVRVADADKSIYNVFYRNDFVFNPARMEINSIAFNTECDKGICSSLYEVFYVKDVNIILPKYLNIFVKRDEFARQCEFIGYGSAREYCRVKDISEISITVPPIEAQQKAVDIYNGLKENLAAYESGLEDLKLTCDGFIDDLKKKLPTTKLEMYLRYSDRRNDEDLDVSHVRGLSIDKKLIPTKANMQDVGLAKYKLLEPGQFAYVPVTSRNGGKITIALNDTNEKYLVSSAYEVFGIDEDKVCSAYLMMFFSRPEFDRYARFHSWGSARESFDWPELCRVEIPLPDIKIQRSIADIYSCYIERKRIAEELKEQMKNICPLLLRGALIAGD